MPATAVSDRHHSGQRRHVRQGVAIRTRVAAGEGETIEHADEAGARCACQDTKPKWLGRRNQREGDAPAAAYAIGDVFARRAAWIRR